MCSPNENVQNSRNCPPPAVSPLCFPKEVVQFQKFSGWEVSFLPTPDPGNPWDSNANLFRYTVTGPIKKLATGLNKKTGGAQKRVSELVNIQNHIVSLMEQIKKQGY